MSISQKGLGREVGGCRIGRVGIPLDVMKLIEFAFLLLKNLMGMPSAELKIRNCPLHVFQCTDSNIQDAQELMKPLLMVCRYASLLNDSMFKCLISKVRTITTKNDRDLDFVFSWFNLNTFGCYRVTTYAF